MNQMANVNISEVSQNLKILYKPLYIYIPNINIE